MDLKSVFGVKKIDTEKTLYPLMHKENPLSIKDSGFSASGGERGI